MHCKTATLIRRDPKKLYFKAKNNLINLIGFNSKVKYERSKFKIYKINTDIKSIDMCVKYVIKIIIKNKI